MGTWILYHIDGSAFKSSTEIPFFGTASMAVSILRSILVDVGVLVV